MQREVLHYDVVIVGAGPAGLASAVRLKQLIPDLTVAILDKGSSVGANIISGCVMDPIALSELIPNWSELDFPVTTKVAAEKMLFLTATKSFKLPIPGKWQNNNNYIISLSKLCRALADYAEQLGVDIYPGFAAVSAVTEQNRIIGVITVEAGLDKCGKPTVNYQAGIELRCHQLIVAEGCRGSLAKQIIQQFKLDKNSTPQTYGLGIKEVWQVEPKNHSMGTVIHCIGYPLGMNAYGGGFLYHQEHNLVSLGLVAALDYSNPYFNPYEEFQRLKLHPQICKVLEGGKRIEYGARTVVEGGVQALPKLTYPGGIIVGDSAGFLNVAKIKGVHNAIKSGMLGAEAIVEAIKNGSISNEGGEACEAYSYPDLVKRSWLYKELYKVRNIRPAFNLGLYFGLFYAAIDYYLFRGFTPWTFCIKTKDHKRLKSVNYSKKINYTQKHDGVYSFDLMASVYLANISHEDNQPCHLKLADDSIPIEVNLSQFEAPETRYCPAGVYEIVYSGNNEQGGQDKLDNNVIQAEQAKQDEKNPAKSYKPRLYIHAQNCIHCKACDIKDPTQNITWIPPASGSGPQYSEM
ncbi:MAG: electron-transferring-flavoprotein dehydrogenase [Pseudomonadota bacterium]|nr:electron-transferring-flavoprotein dehydrogenase [Pseudomonadota bacterium]